MFICETGREKAALLPKIEELNAGACPVDWAKRCVEFARQESCGISVMCRDGMAQLQAILEDITTGMGQDGDLDMLRDICSVISAYHDCELSATAAGNVLYSLEHYADDWNQHCLRKRCAKMICKAYYNLYIDPAACTGCGACRNCAPAGAVDGGEGMIHVIRNDSQLKTGEFEGCCPAGAIKKFGAGAVKPRVPQDPVPVGSFQTGRRRSRGIIRMES